jgi:Leucine-rich repeat (LRR) protein
MDGLHVIKITDLKALSSLTQMKYLNIDRVPVKDLTPLSVLQALNQLYCQGIPLTTSLLPLA